MNLSCGGSLVEHLYCYIEGLDRASSVRLSASNQEGVSYCVIGSVELIESISEIETLLNLLKSGVLLLREDGSNHRQVATSDSSPRVLLQLHHRSRKGRMNYIGLRNSEDKVSPLACRGGGEENTGPL
jgi:hypothetical protein